jgi:hypothetical protein
MLFREVVNVYCEKHRNINIHSVGRMQSFSIVTHTESRLVTGLIEQLYLVTTDNYKTFTDLHTLRITGSNIKASMSAPGAR